MTWVLVVTVMLNGMPQTVEVKPFSEWMCHLMEHKITAKTITLNGANVPVISARCKVDDPQK